MSLFIAFILAATLLGAGGMLSPAWTTAQPRVALAATLCLALICGGAVVYAAIFGWITLGVDYLLFALLAAVVLGGTLSSAQARAEARGERIADRDQGWPGPEDLAFFALVALLLVIPLLRLRLPLGDYAQSLALQTESIREGDLLARFSPGFHALSAYLSQQLGQPVLRIQQSAAAVIALILVWLAYDFGAELRDKRLGRAMALATMLCGGLGGSLLDGRYSQLPGLLFALAFLLYALRLARRFHVADMVAGGLLLGAVVYADISLALAAAMFLALLVMQCWRTGSTRARWALTLGIPLVALLGLAPWLVNMLSMPPAAPVGAAPGLRNLALMTRGQGWLILPLVAWGMAIGLRQDGWLRQVSLLMTAWLLLIMDFALTGIVARILPLGALVDATTFARHAVILPYSYFGGLALLHVWESHLSAAWRGRLRRNAWLLLAIAALAIVALLAAFAPALDMASAWLDLPAASAIQHDALPD